MPQILNIPNLTRSLRLICVASLILSLGACAFLGPAIPSPDEQSEKLEEAMQKGGYAPTRSLAIASSSDIWKHDKTELEVVMTAPTVTGSYPLIIYLPSLGEDAKAGRLWRETWAKAGYAVFSMQPVIVGQALKELKASRAGDPDEAEGDWSEQLDGSGMAQPEEERDGWFGEKKRRPSRTARSSEMHYLGHEYFGNDNLKNRMEQLFWAYRQLKVRADLHQPLYGSADLSKVILAGYDLGAQTVSAVLGENFETVLPTSNELKPAAAILLSPSVNMATGNVRSRFQKLNLPMLAITGTEDTDPYAISSDRQAIWEYAPSGSKYLLMLNDAGHRVLAGNEMGGRFGQRGPGALDAPPGIMGAGHGRRMDGGGLMGGLSDGAERRNMDLGYKHVAAVVSASSAFLDALIKNDEFARFWIDDKANKWLDKAGALKSR